ncbi:hypothetical protein C1E24_17595 [Pseudoalteromonas phenolica]|uniref:DUF418 domain-containing protein n=1 Tax=Pseudoalteromonas phenolica TaxID=161398 RepID=A0A5R9Q019_9GAMM|nr:DUF418 domain-containing protein [Pseudoalteromonas phenolica]TLX45727.1 hypothetical protein C1E24_17595 [Pseudoalteromonas phenolica]
MRIQSIDVLRGIAILGILLMNIYFHGIMSMGYVPFDITPQSDIWVDTFNAIFADGRFRTLFCILFGAGLAIQMKSCEKKGFNYQDFLKSRLNWLMIFGIIHGVFIFGGDILFLYAVCALFIIKKLTLPTRDLFRKAKKWLIIGTVINVLFSILASLAAGLGLEPEMVRGSEAFLEEYNSWMGNYGYQVTIQAIFAAFLVISSPLWVFWQVAGLMLLGIYFYRSGFFKRGLTARQFKTFALAAAALTGLDIFMRLSYFSVGSEVSSLLASISAIFMSILYIHGVIYLLKNNHRWIEVFKAPGRMAFTLYIMQSVVLAILLRWVFPEVHLTASMTDYLAMAVGMILFQLAFANWYLRQFKQGPLEALWRKAYLASFAKKQAKRAEVLA